MYIFSLNTTDLGWQVFLKVHQPGQQSPNEWIPPRARGITHYSIEKGKKSQIIHLFIICGIVLIGIQFSGECGLM